MKDKLKPCSHCGCKRIGISNDVIIGNDILWQIYCTNSKCMVKVEGYTKDFVCEAWNTRQPMLSVEEIGEVIKNTTFSDYGFTEPCENKAIKRLTHGTAPRYLAQAIHDKLGGKK